MPARPRVLLVYANPAISAFPVPPYGAERVRLAMEEAGCEVRLVSPFLGRRPTAALDAALTSFRPDLVGFSIRNLDDALTVGAATGRGPIDTTSFLPAIRPLVARARARGLPVLLGGAGLTMCPEGVMQALGADHAVTGAAEDLVAELGRALVAGIAFPAALPADPRVLRRDAHPHPRRSGRSSASARSHSAPPVALRWPRERGAIDVSASPTPRDVDWLTLGRELGGRVPVALSAGCDRRCHFCAEPALLGGAVRPRPVEAILAEVRALRRADVRRIWLAASELNVPDAHHATAVLRALAAEKLGVDVVGFLQPAPVDDALLDAFEALGVDPAGLAYAFGHLDDGLLRAGAGPANRASLDRLVERYLRRGHRGLGGSVILGGHPEETEESLEGALAHARALDATFPEGFGLAWSAGARVYANSPLGRWVAANLPAARPDLYGRLSPGFAAPLVYCRPGPPRALFLRVRDALAGARGRMRVQNADAGFDAGTRATERLVHAAVLAAAAGDGPGAARACRAALRRAPAHRLALETLGLVQANLLGDREGARRSLRALQVQVGGAWAEALGRVVLRLEGE